MVSFVLIASLVLQLVAVYFAFRLIRITGKSLARSLIAAAIALMALRGATSLGQMFLAGGAEPPDLLVDLIALTISMLIAIGLERFAPIFRGLKSNTDRLRESESRYRELFESLPYAIFIADLDTGHLVDANPKACALIGRPLAPEPCRLARRVARALRESLELLDSQQIGLAIRRIAEIDPALGATLSRHVEYFNLDSSVEHVRRRGCAGGWREGTTSQAGACKEERKRAEDNLDPSRRVSAQPQSQATTPPRKRACSGVTQRVTVSEGARCHILAA